MLSISLLPAGPRDLLQSPGCARQLCCAYNVLVVASSYVVSLTISPTDPAEEPK